VPAADDGREQSQDASAPANAAASKNSKDVVIRAAEAEAAETTLTPEG
jgi:hypothetical protein